MLKIIGILLVVIGIAALVIPSLTFTKTEQVADLGVAKINKTEKERIPLSPILGVSALVVGAGLLVVGATRKA